MNPDIEKMVQEVAKTLAVLLCALILCSATHRSSTVRRQFRKTHPCPATGLTKGRCGGYVIDHLIPLRCGGLDVPANLQWQSVADAKAKDRLERNCYNFPDSPAAKEGRK